MPSLYNMEEKPGKNHGNQEITHMMHQWEITADNTVKNIPDLGDIPWPVAPGHMTAIASVAAELLNEGPIPQYLGARDSLIARGIVGPHINKCDNDEAFI